MVSRADGSAPCRKKTLKRKKPLASEPPRSIHLSLHKNASRMASSSPASARGTSVKRGDGTEGGGGGGNATSHTVDFSRARVASGVGSVGQLNGVGVSRSASASPAKSNNINARHSHDGTGGGGRGDGGSTAQRSMDFGIARASSATAGSASGGQYINRGGGSSSPAKSNNNVRTSHECILFHLTGALARLRLPHGGRACPTTPLAQPST